MPAGLTDKRRSTWLRLDAKAVAGPLVFIAVLVGVMSPRSMAFWLPLLLLAAGLPALVFPARGQLGASTAEVLQRLGPTEKRALGAVAVFAVWALISTIWSRGSSSARTRSSSAASSSDSLQPRTLPGAMTA